MYISLYTNIKNQNERDAVVKEYLAVKEKIKNHDSSERGDLIERRRYLEQEYINQDFYS